mmetsp:Transcript_48168/g.151110  ORF Transcript_48168/g.151110 Transcript_48168/m.151110 type:complete len:200 (+) Transcript_48168:1508-2107(+)
MLVVPIRVSGLRLPVRRDWRRRLARLMLDCLVLANVGGLLPDSGNDLAHLEEHFSVFLLSERGMVRLDALCEMFFSLHPSIGHYHTPSVQFAPLPSSSKLPSALVGESAKPIELILEEFAFVAVTVGVGVVTFPMSKPVMPLPLIFVAVGPYASPEAFEHASAPVPVVNPSVCPNCDTSAIRPAVLELTLVGGLGRVQR